MFYDKQPINQREDYKEMLALVGSLSNLFSAADAPLLHYRAHENIFCKYFEAENLAREDSSADAKKGTVGIGLKTWVKNDNQKVAEFGKLKNQYANLTGLALAKQISAYRNERIRITKNLHGIDEMIYHIVKRIPCKMEIYELLFDSIDIDKIKYIKTEKNNIWFSDNKHTYHFNLSKSTLYMIFDNMEKLDSFEVEILDDPYSVLKMLKQPASNKPALLTVPVPAPKSLPNAKQTTASINPTGIVNFDDKKKKKQLCLRLYTISPDGTKYVPTRSGLNQWNANGRKRDVDELYIAYPVEDRKRDESFFPPRDTPFTLILPNNTKMGAKVCQRAYKKVSESEYNSLSKEDKIKEDKKAQVGKAIMSNPNKALGNWLLRTVFNIPERTLVTYEMLMIYDVDSVLFTKISDEEYKIDFCPQGTYEEMYDKEN